MSYLRTNTNIFEIIDENDLVYRVKAKGNPYHIYSKSKRNTEIIKIADTIEELIDIGDLVGLVITDDYDEPLEKRTRTIREVIGVGINDVAIMIDTDDNDFDDYSSSIVKLYIKMQNGDYKLVAKKKSLERELELV